MKINLKFSRIERVIDAKLHKTRKLDLQTEDILSLNEREASNNTPR
jgi:hypothetical protein